jgi:hypothetical protein
MERKARHILILMLMAVMFLPMLQQLGQFWKEKPLFGIAMNAPKPRLELKNWLDGTYQDSIDAYATQNAGFHNALVRLNNQYFYSIYHTAQANKVVVGRDNCLYDQAHIDSYLGKDYIGEQAILDKMLDLQRIREIFKKKKIELVLVLVPGKGMSLPQYIPGEARAKGVKTNYQSFSRMADSLSIPQLDLVKWYSDQRFSSIYPLYPMGGNHWSEYCATLAADTLFGFISKQMQTELNRFSVTKVHYPSPASPIDDDINLGMNLLFPISATPMAYPEIQWKGKPQKLRVLTIGDSFYFKAFTDFSGPIFEQSKFWFYFRELHQTGQPNPKSNAEVDLRMEIETQDLIMLYVADLHLTDLGFGFIESALEAYLNPEWRSQQLGRIVGDIQKDPEWMAKISEKAAAQNLPVDTMLLRDAVWVLENSRLPQQ